MILQVSKIAVMEIESWTSLPTLHVRRHAWLDIRLRQSLCDVQIYAFFSKIVGLEADYEERIIKWLEPDVAEQALLCPVHYDESSSPLMRHYLG